jgi:hypothetical protein
MIDPTPEMLAAEFDCFLARAKIVIPEERRAAILATYPDFRTQIDLLHAVRPASAEPSNIYRIAPGLGVSGVGGQ